MKLLLFTSVFIGMLSFYLCNRTLPSSIPYVISLKNYGSRSQENLAFSQEKNSFSQAYLGQLLSLFAMTSSMSFLVSGIMSDHINVKLLFSVALGLSGLILTAFPLIGENHTLGLMLYTCLGLTLGCSWPCTAKILRQTYQPSELGVPWGLMATSSSIATLLAPLLVAWINSTGSWKYTFYYFGSVALSLAIPIMIITNFLTVTDDSVSDKKSKEASTSSRLYWYHVMCEGPLWGVMVAHAMIWVGKATVQDWGQLYLIQKHGLDEVTAGNSIGFMQLGGISGKLLMGYISNWAMKQQSFGGLTTSGQTCRCVVLILDLVLLCMALVMFAVLPVAPINRIPYFMLLVIFCIGLFSEGANINITLMSMDVVPSNLAGTGQAVSAATSQLVGRSLAGWPFTALTQWIGWSSAFFTVSISGVVAVASGSGLAVYFHQKHLEQKKEK